MRFRPAVSFLFFIPLVGCPKGEEKIALPSAAPAVEQASSAVVAESAAEKGNGTESLVAGDVAYSTSNLHNEPVKGLSDTQHAAGTAAKSSEKPATNRISGQVVAGMQGQIGFKVPGHLSAFTVKVGQTVQKGQVLAVIVDSEYSLRLKAALAQVELSQIGQQQSKRDFEREVQLKKEGATTEISFERASNAMEQARLAAAQAEIGLAQARKAMADTKLIAPFDGIVSKRFKAEGEHVGVGAPVFELSSVGDIEVSLKVPESFLKSVTVGGVVSLSIPSINKETEIIIERIVPVIQESTRTFEVIGKLKTPDPAIVPGQFVEARFAL